VRYAKAFRETAKKSGRREVEPKRRRRIADRSEGDEQGESNGKRVRH
jgi:hypothetical protein